MVGKFKPLHELTVRPSQIMMRVEGKEKERIKAAATSHGLSLEEFCRQAIRFAIENLDKP